MTTDMVLTAYTLGALAGLAGDGTQNLQANAAAAGKDAPARPAAAAGVKH